MGSRQWLISVHRVRSPVRRQYVYVNSSFAMRRRRNWKQSVSCDQACVRSQPVYEENKAKAKVERLDGCGRGRGAEETEPGDSRYMPTRKKMGKEHLFNTMRVPLEFLLSTYERLRRIQQPLFSFSQQSYASLSNSQATRSASLVIFFGTLIFCPEYGSVREATPQRVVCGVASPCWPR